MVPKFPEKFIDSTALGFQSTTQIISSKNTLKISTKTIPEKETEPEKEDEKEEEKIESAPVEEEEEKAEVGSETESQGHQTELMVNQLKEVTINEPEEEQVNEESVNGNNVEKDSFR